MIVKFFFDGQLMCIVQAVAWEYEQCLCKCGAERKWQLSHKFHVLPWIWPTFPVIKQWLLGSPGIASMTPETPLAIEIQYNMDEILPGNISACAPPVLVHVQYGPSHTQKHRLTISVSNYPSCSLWCNSQACLAVIEYTFVQVHVLNFTLIW